jgi:hypothetical protein
MVALRLGGPLHVGLRPTGNLKQTRRYVVGRAIWGAIVERAAKWHGAKSNADFWGFQQQVTRCLRFSYAYPSDSASAVHVWPWGDQQDEFDWLFLQSYTSTALVDGRTKEDGSLHETECIGPLTREGKPVYLLFHLWSLACADDSTEPGVREWLTETVHQAAFWTSASLGGERSYGWGRISSAHVVKLSANGGSLFERSGWFWSYDEAGFPRVRADVDRGSPGTEIRALAHAVGGSFDGRLEPLTGRSTVDGKFGQSIPPPVGCHVPGAILRPGGQDRYGVDPFGCWI